MIYVRNGLHGGNEPRVSSDRSNRLKLLGGVWVVLLLPTYWQSTPLGLLWACKTKPQTWMAPGLWLALVMVLWPVSVYVPCHFVFRQAFPQRSGDPSVCGKV